MQSGVFHAALAYVLWGLFPLYFRLLGDLPAGGEVKAELRGVPWSARAASGASLRAGQRCRVERVDGLTLWVRAEDSAR